MQKVENIHETPHDGKPLLCAGAVSKDGISLIHGDSLQALKSYGDNYFDVAIVDPPYGIDWMQQIQNPNTKANWKQYENKEWDKQTPTDEYWEQLFRVSKNQIVWGWNYFVEYFHSCPSYIVWNKEASGNYSDCEIAWCSYKGTNKIFKWLWNGFRKQQPEERIHPTQKPVALYDWIIQNYCAEANLILDTHVGSGSSRIAAAKAGKQFIGFEIDPEYYEKQEKRFNDWNSQLRMF